MDTWSAVRAALARPGPGAFCLDGLSRAEVWAMAAWLKKNLPHQGDAPVCLAAEDRALIAAAVLAALAGGPPLLFPHTFSGQVLAEVRRESGYRQIISEVERDLPFGVERLCPPASLSEYSGDELFADGFPGPDVELLRLYTGGSTGKPRIWRKTAACIFLEMACWREFLRVSEDDRILATVPPWHIYGFLHSVAMPLISGAAVATETPSFPEEIAALARSHRATILISAPPHYRALRGKPFHAPSLRFALSSTGPLAEEDNDSFCKENGVGIIEGYGSTETGGAAWRNRFQGGAAFTPFAPVHWRVENGNLLVTTPWMSPDLPCDADGFFAIGDRVAVSGQGFVLRGRVGSIVKVAGKRVDLEEVTAAIKAFPEARDCLALALAEDSARGNRIAVLVAGDFAVDSLKQFLLTRLESHALPKILRVVESIPMKATGKYDREAALRLLGLG